MSKLTDYQRFCQAAKDLGAERMQILGKLHGMPDENLQVESWYFEGPPRQSGEGFFLIHNKTNGTIGVYEFAGPSGAPIEQDIKWLMAKYQQVQSGNGRKKAD